MKMLPVSANRLPEVQKACLKSHTRQRDRTGSAGACPPKGSYPMQFGRCPCAWTSSHSTCPAPCLVPAGALPKWPQPHAIQSPGACALPGGEGAEPAGLPAQRRIYFRAWDIRPGEGGCATSGWYSEDYMSACCSLSRPSTQPGRGECPHMGVGACSTIQQRPENPSMSASRQSVGKAAQLRGRPEELRRFSGLDWSSCSGVDAAQCPPPPDRVRLYRCFQSMKG